MNKIIKIRPSIGKIYTRNLRKLKKKVPNAPFIRGYEDIIAVNKDIRIKLVFYGIHCISRFKDPITSDEWFDLANTNQIILHTIETLAPRDFLRIFPLEKRYDGEKYEVKDYFSSMQAINEYGIDRRIENAIDFLFDYMNLLVHLYCVRSLSITEFLIIDSGGISPASEFFHNEGIFEMPTYKGDNGTEYVVNKFGKPIKLNKYKKSHVRRVK